MPRAPIVIGTTRDEFPALDLESRSARSRTGHLVALAWVFDPARASILLVEHRASGWSCPGGHVEPGEDPLAATRRELAEETGLEMEPVAPEPTVLARSVGCPRSGPETVHWAIGYVFLVDPTTQLIAEPGQRASWFEVDDLPRTRAGDIDIVTTRLGRPPGTRRDRGIR